MNAGIEQKHLKDALAYYIEELAASVPQAKECEGITFSPRFEKRMERMIRDHQKTFYFWFNTAGKRVASIVVAVVLALSTVVLSVDAARETLIQFITKTYERFTQVIIHIEGEAPQTVVPVEPAYIPDEFVQKKRIEDANHCSIYYERTDGHYLKYSQTLLTTGKGIDTEDAEQHPVVINGHEGIISITRHDYVVLVFSSDEYIFTVIGSVDEFEILKIAESIPLKK